MFRKYLLTAYRSIIQNKAHTLINIFGLIISLTAVALISLYIHYQLTTDHHHKNIDNIYRIHHQDKSAWTSWQLAETLKNKLPELKHIVRLNVTVIREFTIKYKNNPYELKDIILADPSLTEIFTYKVKYGDLNDALQKPMSVIINESYSEKIFGDINPVGKEIQYFHADTIYSLTITAVIKDIQQNSSLLFNGVISMNSLPIMMNGQQWAFKWSSQMFQTYGLFQDDIIKDNLEKKIQNIIYDVVPDNSEKNTVVSLHPLKTIYFNKTIHDRSRHGSLSSLYILGSTASFILFLAIINFVNLSIANATLKAREIGLRKVVGAKKRELIYQFLSESIIISAIAINFAIIITNFLLPWFNSIAETDIHYIQLDSLQVWLIIIISIIVLGFISGIYPAFYLTRFNPIETVKGIITVGKKKSFLKNLLVTIQYTVSIIIIIATIIFFKQLNFIKNIDLGFDKKNIIYLRYTPEIVSLDYFKEQLIKDPNIQDVTKTYFLQGVGGYQHWEGIELYYQGEELKMDVEIGIVDENFFNIMDYQVVEGRGFSKEMDNDEEVCILNEAAVKEIGCKNPLEIKFTKDKLKVIGVMKDFCRESLHSAPEPLVFINSKAWYYNRYILIKTKSNDLASLSQTLKHIKSIWEEVTPNFEFIYHFYDESLDRYYKAEKQFEKIFFYFSILSIIIAALGVLGLVSITTLQRTKEIGIRKANGSSLRQILHLLNTNYLKLVFIACIIACPLAWYGMNKWLENFAYKTPLSWWVFILAGIICATVTIFIVTFQSYKTAVRNPADSLRYE